MTSHRLLRLFVPLLIAAACAAQQPSAGRDVTLTASDGIALKATYFAGKPGPGVLLLHQCNQTRTAWNTLAERLATAGFNVLTFDYRGFGESGGTPGLQLSQPEQAKVFSQTWPGDVDVALAYLSAQPGVKREVIGVGGASCGVEQALTAARRHPEVKSLVLLSGGANPDDRRFLRKAASLPIFIAVADDDTFGNASAIMKWLFELTPNPGNKFVRYPTGGHGNEMFAAHKELPGAIVDWFETTLIKSPGRASGTRPTPKVNPLAIVEEPNGPRKVAQMLADARKSNPDAEIYPEYIVNVLGYERLQAGDTGGAVEFFKLNVEAFPRSPNVYDSLADAYLAGGDTSLALKNAQQALDLLPSDTADNEQRRKAIQESAEEKLKKLGGQKK